MSKTDTGRRKFMLTFGIGGAAAAAAAVTHQVRKGEAHGQKVQTEPSQGYRLTEHIRDYYRTCRV